jgi:hypothetical protein
VTENEPAGEGAALVLLQGAELGPEGEGEAVEDLDLNDSNDWEFVP